MHTEKKETVYLGGSYPGKYILEIIRWSVHLLLAKEFKIDSHIGFWIHFQWSNDIEWKHDVFNDPFPMFTISALNPDRYYSQITVTTHYLCCPRWLHWLYKLKTQLFFRGDFWGNDKRYLLHDPETLSRKLQEVMNEMLRLLPKYVNEFMAKEL